MGKTKVFRGFFVFLRRKSPNGDGKKVADRSKGACIYLVATESWTYDDALRALWKREKLAPRTMTVFRAIGALVQGGLKVYPPLRGWFFFLLVLSQNWDWFCRLRQTITNSTKVWFGWRLLAGIFLGWKSLRRNVFASFFFFSFVEPGFVNFAARFI